MNKVITNQRIKNQKISDFMEDLSSNRPTPGGGAVAALTASFGASLCEMVANLTKKDLKDVVKKTKVLRKRLLELADLDVKAFNKVMAAYKTKNKEKIELALKNATIVPLETARLCDEVRDIASVLTREGNKNAYSDAKSAYYLAEAARKSALENVKINLKFIKDEKWKKKIKY
jgi:methenyltetrahydrofolate cyclohydrolase